MPLLGFSSSRTRRILSSALLTTATAATTYAILIYTRLSHSAPSNQITSAKYVSNSLNSSDTVTKLINPNGFPSRSDSRSVTLKMNARARPLVSFVQQPGITKEKREHEKNIQTDEEILALFTRGFFGGWVFAPERAMLTLLGGIVRNGLVSYPKCDDSETSEDIWTASQVSDRNLPGIGTIFFGAFQVVDKRIVGQSNRQSIHTDLSASSEDESYIDFAYGAKDSRFAGVHRFSIARQRVGRNGGGKDGEMLRITMACVTCNAKEDRRELPMWAWGFHRAYAMLLFREAVAEVVR